MTNQTRGSSLKLPWWRTRATLRRTTASRESGGEVFTAAPRGGTFGTFELTSAIDTARALYAAVNRGDRDGALALLREDAELVSAAGWATGTGQMQQGREGLRRWFKEVEAQEIEPAVIVHDAVEVCGRAVCMLTVRGLRGGEPVDLAANVWSVITVDEDGLIASSWSYRSERDALSAAESGRASGVGSSPGAFSIRPKHG